MDRRQAIVEAATQLFAELGFSATSTAEIAERAGVAEGTLFHHFKSKKGLLEEIIKERFEGFHEGLEQSIKSSENGLEAIENMIRFHFRFIEEKSSAGLMMFRDFPFQQPDSSPSLIQEGKKASQRIVQLLSLCLDRGRVDGSVREVAVMETALIVRSLLYGVVRHQFMDPLDLTKMADEVIRFCRRSLAPESLPDSNPHFKP